MSETLLPYSGAVLALGVYGALYLVQLLVADVIGIRRGHTPGVEVKGGHEDLHFRATRAHANTTESAAAVVMIAGFAIAVAVAPETVSTLLWVYLASRVVHMLAYYCDIKLLRSIAFAVGVTVLFLLFGLGLREF